MKGKGDKETIKHWITLLVSKFYKRNGLEGRGEGQVPTESEP